MSSDSPHHKGAGSRPHWELADVLRNYSDSYRFQQAMPLDQLKVIQAITACRTAALGGHLDQCNQCGFQQNSYNSCRNRHCPKCQTMAKEQWLQDRKAELLPISYFHNVFTLPHELNPLVLCNKKVLFNLLFTTVSQTLQDFAQDPKYKLNGQLGLIAVLHTWDQRLLDHFHLHCLIPAGVLSKDKKRFTKTKPNFLFPVKALSRVFRGKFMEGLNRAFEKNKLIFPGKTAPLGTKDGFKKLTQELWKKEWVVYSKKPFAGPEQVLEYLGRYTHRVAISNHRILSVANGKVSFSYRDRQDNNQSKVMTLDANEFIRRFLLHVLPKGFYKIRSFGFLANRNKKENLAQCRSLLKAPPPEKQDKLSVHELMLQLTDKDIFQCPQCESGKMARLQELKPIPP